MTVSTHIIHSPSGEKESSHGIGYFNFIHTWRVLPPLLSLSGQRTSSLTSRSRLPQSVINHNSSRSIQVSLYPLNSATVLVNFNDPSSSTASRQVDRVLEKGDAKGVANTPVAYGGLPILTVQEHGLDCTEPSVHPPDPAFFIIYC